MTNGTLTKKILAAAKMETGEQLKRTAMQLMSRFPLSSHHLLYEGDKSKVPTEAWNVLVQAAVATDGQKLREKNSLLTEAGLKPDRTFGRYTAPKRS